MTTNKSRLAFFSVLLAGALMTGCGKTVEVPKPTASSPVIMIFDVVNAKPLVKTGFNVSAVGRAGQKHAPFTSAQIDLTMPGMTMPPNVIQLKQSAPGQFSGSGTFTMSGKWTATVHLTMQDGKSVDQDFPVSL